MKPPKNLLLCVLLMPSLFITISQAQRPPPATIDQSFISFLISTKGLEFVKDLLITEAVSSLTPLDIPPIQNTRKIPFLGNVNFLLSNITIYQINVSESYIKPGDSGVAIIVSGATANLSMNWYYSYSTAWLLPIEISDKGNASVEVEGMQVGLTIGFGNQEGILKLSLLECGCFVEDINIKLDGGASWLYQGFVDAFVGEIDSAVENAVTKKLKEGLLKLDSLLQSLPNEIPIDDMAYLNVSFVNDPVLSSSSIGFEVNGLFTPRERMPISDFNHKDLLTFSCDDPSKMLGISVDEAVFRSASSLYFNAGYLQWIVDKIPDQSLLNTAGWRFIIPQLYKKYPNDDMNLNISFASAPAVRILRDSIDAMVYADLIIDVLEDHEVIPVACILLEIQATGSVKILSNYLVGSVKLDDFTMSLKWSKIGNLRMRLIQPVVWTLIQTVFLPFANTRLGKGFPLPIIRGFTLENAGISFSNSSIVVCSDVAYEKSYDLALQIL
ncbi:hypothetical protein Nepgr_000564 [Nepenthes gracilis]|uniref:Lipid-binding serum glycoprotein C-terminal domain-containing protein n=1 Tax=Nepenthes gracilis TaxID=150966 RepID=A0AAD3P1X1_NEPGR|nr:hypothetical protein Nepgr_000564 [Nepenthes gracilis]